MVNESLLLGVVIAILIIGFVMGIGIYAARYKRVAPDKAMVIYGRKKGVKGFEVMSGGGAFIYPIVEDYAYLPLDVRTLEIVVADIVTDVKTSGAKLNIKAVTQIKIASDKASLLTAAEHLLHKSDAEINEIAIKTLEGHVRGICATMTIEAINSDRDTVSEKIQTMAARDLRNMGIEIRSFVIKELEDEYGYLDALGRRGPQRSSVMHVSVRPTPTRRPPSGRHRQPSWVRRPMQMQRPRSHCSTGTGISPGQGPRPRSKWSVPTGTSPSTCKTG